MAWRGRIRVWAGWGLLIAMTLASLAMLGGRIYLKNVPGKVWRTNAGGVITTIRLNEWGVAHIVDREPAVLPGPYQFGRGTRALRWNDREWNLWFFYYVREIDRRFNPPIATTISPSEMKRVPGHDYVRTTWAFSLSRSAIMFALPMVGWLFFILLRAIGQAIVRRERGYAYTGECPKCAYDLRGTPDHCPECGWHAPPRVDAKELAERLGHVD